MFFAAIVVGLFFGGLELTCFFARPLYINFRKLGLPAYAASNIPSTIKYTLRENELSHPDAGLLFHVQQNPSGEPIQGYTGINALGFRGNVYDPNLHSDDETKVMILGDSCAFGWGILDYRLTFRSPATAAAKEKLYSIGGFPKSTRISSLFTLDGMISGKHPS